MDQSPPLAAHEDLRIALLQSMPDLALIPVLERPGLHLLCDAPMEAHFLRAGLRRSQMTQALEHGSFLATGFTLRCDPKATLVIATRRSELAALGVMQRRNQRAMGLFRTLLPRLIAKAPAGINAAAVMASPAPATRYAILGQPGFDGNLLADALTGLGCGKPAVHLGPSQILFAQHRDATDFELSKWWNMLQRTQAVGDVFATILLWPALSAFFDQLSPRETDWLVRGLAKFAVLRLKSADLLPTAVAAHMAEVPDEPSVNPTPDILHRLDNLRADETALDAWLAQSGISPLVIDNDTLRTNPNDTAKAAAHHLGLTPAAKAPTVPRPAPTNPRFARLLDLARTADASRFRAQSSENTTL